MVGALTSGRGDRGSGCQTPTGLPVWWPLYCYNSLQKNSIKSTEDKYLQGAWPWGEPHESYREDGELRAENCVWMCPWSWGLSWAKRTIPRTRRRVSPCWHLLRSSRGKQSASACKLSLCSGSKLDALLPLFYGTLNSTGSFCCPSCPKARSLQEKNLFYPLWDLSGSKRAMWKATLASHT